MHHLDRVTWLSPLPLAGRALTHLGLDVLPGYHPYPSQGELCLTLVWTLTWLSPLPLAGRPLFHLGLDLHEAT